MLPGCPPAPGSPPRRAALALLVALLVGVCDPGIRMPTWRVRSASVQAALPPSTLRSLSLVRRVLASHAQRLRAVEREAVARAIVDAERELGLEPLLVLALIAQESRFDPRAIGPRESLGLMQVRPFVGEAVAAAHRIPWRGDATLFDPVANVRIGTLYLAELRDRFDSVERTLAAYNMGPQRLARLLRAAPAPGVGYVMRVRGHYDGFQQRYGTHHTRWGG